MNDSKIIAKLKNYYLNDTKFYNLCQDYLLKENLEDNLFWELHNNYSDLNIYSPDFVSFLRGILNWNNSITELCQNYSSNVYYLAGQKIKKSKMSNSPFFSIAAQPEYVNKFTRFNQYNFVSNSYMHEIVKKLNSIPFTYEVSKK